MRAWGAQVECQAAEGPPTPEQAFRAGRVSSNRSAMPPQRANRILHPLAPRSRRRRDKPAYAPRRHSNECRTTAHGDPDRPYPDRAARAQAGDSPPFARRPGNVRTATCAEPSAPVQEQTCVLRNAVEASARSTQPFARYVYRVFSAGMSQRSEAQRAHVENVAAAA